MPESRREERLLVDFGSTYTKACAIDVTDGRLLGLAKHPTTLDGDILDGFNAALGNLDASVQPYAIHIDACSSAGGGLRIGVVGLEEDLTAEAARRVALTAGARIVRLISGGLCDEEATAHLAASRPDIVLLAGGTDGGNAACLTESAAALARHSLDVPIILAGNQLAQDQAAELLERAGKRVVRAENVMPAIGIISERSVREWIRELFIGHVIGGKRLSSSPGFASLVRMATPDAVLRGAEVLSQCLARRGEPSGVVVVDVGGATTDVHSVVVAAPREELGYKRSLIPHAMCARTVEGDLGLRWNAESIVEVAAREGLLTKHEARGLAAAAKVRADFPAYVPEDEAEACVDLTLARLAITTALRRHTGKLAVSLKRDGAVLERRGRDLRAVRTVVGTGGIFSHARFGALEAMMEAAVSARGNDQRLLPEAARVIVDRSYLLGAAGLLALDNEYVASRLLKHEVLNVEGTT
jgi:uncharacterized protein (TIGR01319 family)